MSTQKLDIYEKPKNAKCPPPQKKDSSAIQPVAVASHDRVCSSPTFTAKLMCAIFLYILC